MEQYDVVVIGGGTAGMMAAISAASLGVKTIVVEKNDKVGKKLLATGGGRCNVTNNKDIHGLIAHIPGNGKFLYSAFNAFNYEDIVSFFSSCGVTLKEEDYGRMFPVTNTSKTIVDALEKMMETLQVHILKGKTVNDILFENGKVVSIKIDDQVMNAKSVIVACGGRAAPKTGSTGEGYKWARKAGHTIETLYPTEVPLLSEEEFIKNGSLMGLSLRNVSLSVLDKEKEIISHTMDVIFTHFGMSGPAALRCSMFVNRMLQDKNVEKVVMKLDVLPTVSREDLMITLLTCSEKEKQKSVKNILKTLVPERYALFLLQTLKIEEQSIYKTISKKQIMEILDSIKNFRFYVTGTLPIEKAFVTGGGVAVKEIHPKTMESKYVEGLYFAGEILDINGYTGGYNITAAFSTGYVAGQNAAMKIYESSDV